MQKEVPILFQTEMVEAILDRRKTMTRRLKTKIQPGDIIWVKETTYLPGYDYTDSFDESGEYETRFIQTGNRLYKASSDRPDKCKCVPSIFMPKSACRIWLRCTDRREEHLLDISDEDAIAEGIQVMPSVRSDNGPVYKNYKNPLGVYSSPCNSFMSLWEKINGIESFVENPMLSVINFEVLSTTGKPNS